MTKSQNESVEEKVGSGEKEKFEQALSSDPPNSKLSPYKEILDQNTPTPVLSPLRRKSSHKAGDKIHQLYTRNSATSNWEKMRKQSREKAHESSTHGASLHSNKSLKTREKSPVFAENDDKKKRKQHQSLMLDFHAKKSRKNRISTSMNPRKAPSKELSDSKSSVVLIDELSGGDGLFNERILPKLRKNKMSKLYRPSDDDPQNPTEVGISFPNIQNATRFTCHGLDIIINGKSTFKNISCYLVQGDINGIAAYIDSTPLGYFRYFKSVDFFFLTDPDHGTHASSIEYTDYLTEFTIIFEESNHIVNTSYLEDIRGDESTLGSLRLCNSKVTITGKTSTFRDYSEVCNLARKIYDVSGVTPNLESACRNYSGSTRHRQHPERMKLGRKRFSTNHMSSRQFSSYSKKIENYPENNIYYKSTQVDQNTQYHNDNQSHFMPSNRNDPIVIDDDSEPESATHVPSNQLADLLTKDGYQMELSGGNEILEEDKGSKAQINHSDDLNDPSTVITYYPLNPNPNLSSSGLSQLHITVYDFNTLKEGEFLNDIIIEFYLKFLMDNILAESLHPKFYVFNSYFYHKYTSSDGKQFSRRLRRSHGGSIGSYDRIKNWMKKSDIFQRDFVIIPINESAHWYLAIICYPWKLIQNCASQEESKDQNARASSNESSKQSDWTNTLILLDHEPEVCSSSPGKDSDAKVQAEDPIEEDPYILIFDSLGLSRQRCISNLKSLLISEANHHLGFEISRPKIRQCKADVPMQPNNSDCGLFLLQYAEEFLKHPHQSFCRVVKRDTKKWFPVDVAVEKRSVIRKELEKLSEIWRSRKRNACNETESEESS